MRLKIRIFMLLSLLPFTFLQAQNITADQTDIKKISLNFQKIELRAVLQIMSEFQGVNVVVSDRVKGEISLHLNNIPWEEALDVILKMNALDKRITGNIMLIAPADDLLKQDQISLKRQQKISILMPLQNVLVPINYASAADIGVLLREKQHGFLTQRGSLSVDTRTNSIWVEDIADRIKVVRKLIRQLDTPVKQVLIEARIVNVSRETVNDMGIHFGASSTLGSGSQSLQTSVPVKERRLNLDFGAAAASVTSGLVLAKLADGILLDLELSALESENKAEIIAAPRLMTTDQQTAVIESGEEVPYQEGTLSGATAVAFKKAVLKLKVTPRITPVGKLLMTLQINQDALSARDINGVPAILTKEIQTNVLVNDGQTVVLGGIYKQNKIKSERRVPFFGELPVLGILFRNKHVEIKNEELLIFITPRIITDAMPEMAEGNKFASFK